MGSFSADINEIALFWVHKDGLKQIYSDSHSYYLFILTVLFRNCHILETDGAWKIWWNSRTSNANSMIKYKLTENNDVYRKVSIV